MEMVTSVLLVMMGFAGGVCATYFYLRVKLKEVCEQVKEESKQMKTAAESKRKADEAERERYVEQIQDLNGKLQKAHEEINDYREQVQAEARKRTEAETRIGLIPGLESQLNEKVSRLEKLQEEKEALAAKFSDLEAVIKEQQGVIKEQQDSLVFVHGNHYLPGAVIRSLIGKDSKPSGE